MADSTTTFVVLGIIVVLSSPTACRSRFNDYWKLGLVVLAWYFAHRRGPRWWQLA